MVGAAVTAVAAAGPATAVPRVLNLPQVAATHIRQIAAHGDPPALLPGRLPVDARGRLVATAGLTRTGWSIVVGSPGCNGANACSVARFWAVRGGSPSGPVSVRLARGVAGRFTPMSCGASCALPSVSFRVGGATYTFAVSPVGRHHRAQLVRLANQAIAAGPRGAASEAAAAPARRKVVCSQSGDSCMGIYLRAGKIVLRRTYIERYMARDRLCVRYPDRSRACRVAPLRRAGGAWEALAVFPRRGPGTYVVVGIPAARITVT